MRTACCCNRVSLVELAYERIEELIINCELKPGQFLAIQDLREITGFSRTPVHQAVSRLADDTLIGCYELSAGWVRVEHVKIGKRAFVGNSGMVSAGRKVPKESLVAVLSAAPRRKAVKAGSSWLGSPPTRLPTTRAPRPLPPSP